MMTVEELQAGDYIGFTTVVVPEVKGAHRGAGGKAFPYTITEAYWTQQAGSGYVVKVNKSARKLPVSAGNPFAVSHRTAKVDAGPLLGSVTVSIDDAVLVGKQLDLGMVAEQAASAGMYDTRGAGA